MRVWFKYFVDYTVAQLEAALGNNVYLATIGFVLQGLGRKRRTDLLVLGWLSLGISVGHVGR